MVLGAVFLSLLQSWLLPALSTGAHALGALVGSPFLQRLEFVRAAELVFGLILVGMMLYRRDGLIPAARPSYHWTSKPPPCSAAASRERCAASGRSGRPGRRWRCGA